MFEWLFGKKKAVEVAPEPRPYGRLVEGGERIDEVIETENKSYSLVKAAVLGRLLTEKENQ